MAWGGTVEAVRTLGELLALIGDGLGRDVMGRQSVKRLTRRGMEREYMVTVMGVGEGYGGLMAKVE